MAQPRVLMVETPEDRLPFYQTVIGEFDAATSSSHPDEGSLDQLLQHDYALIFLNLPAPGSDVAACVQRIRSSPHNQYTPIVLVGVPSAAAVAERCEGPVDFMPAPVTQATLREKLRLFLQLHRAQVARAAASRSLEQRMAERTAQLQAANRSETRLRREAEELSALKDEFLATMSHELRTPLNAIFGWITLLRTGRLDGPTAERALETIERNARAQKRLIDDLLDVSRIVSGKVQLEPSDVDPRQVLEAALATMAPAAAARRITIVPDLPEGAAPLRADAARLQQVVCNLLSNAIKFTPEGGTVHIRMERGPAQMQITVTDTGQGISAEFLPHVFDRFRQEDGSISRKHSGLGLGLAIVRHLVELHGGSVAVASRGEGQGATFTVRIPARAVAASAPVESVPVPAGIHQLAGMAVLVVDDDPGSREVVASMLQGYGARVATAQGGERALSLLREQVPDVLIADLAMPQVTGIDLIHHVRSLPADQGGQIPAIAVSAFASSTDRLLALQAGFDRHLAKPVEPSELVSAVLATLQRK